MPAPALQLEGEPGKGDEKRGGERIDRADRRRREEGRGHRMEGRKQRFNERHYATRS
jgi:hypothetical protein